MDTSKIVYQFAKLVRKIHVPMEVVDATLDLMVNRVAKRARIDPNVAYPRVVRQVTHFILKNTIHFAIMRALEGDQEAN